MRVMLVTDAYPPMVGGAPRSTQQLARHLVLRGHEISVATSWQPDCLTRERGADGVDVHRVRDLTSRVPCVSADPYQHVPPPFPDPEAILRLRRLIRTVRPELIHAYGWLGHSVAVAMKSELPLLVTARDYGNFCAVRTLMQNGEQVCSGPAGWKCLRCASRFYGPAKGAAAVIGTYAAREIVRRRISGLHAVSSYVGEQMRAHLLTPRQRSSLPIAVIPNFRDAPSCEVDEEFLRRLPERPFILFVEPSEL